MNNYPKHTQAPHQRAYTYNIIAIYVEICKWGSGTVMKMVALQFSRRARGRSMVLDTVRDPWPIIMDLMPDFRSTPSFAVSPTE